MSTDPKAVTVDVTEEIIRLSLAELQRAYERNGAVGQDISTSCPSSSGRTASPPAS